jgi:hypothetical protein
VSHRAFMQNTANPVDHIVRSHSRRLIDNQDCIHEEFKISGLGNFGKLEGKRWFALVDLL